MPPIETVEKSHSVRPVPIPVLHPSWDEFVGFEEYLTDVYWHHGGKEVGIIKVLFNTFMFWLFSCYFVLIAVHSQVIPPADFQPSIELSEDVIRKLTATSVFRQEMTKVDGLDQFYVSVASHTDPSTVNDLWNSVPPQQRKACNMNEIKAENKIQNVLKKCWRSLECGISGVYGSSDLERESLFRPDLQVQQFHSEYFMRLRSVFMIPALESFQTGNRFAVVRMYSRC